MDPKGLLLLDLLLWLLCYGSFERNNRNFHILTIIFLHSFLMIGVSLVMMPAQTNGLNQFQETYIQMERL